MALNAVIEQAMVGGVIRSFKEWVRLKNRLYKQISTCCLHVTSLLIQPQIPASKPTAVTSSHLGQLPSGGCQNCQTPR